LQAAQALQQGQLGGLGLQQQALGSLGNLYGQGMQNMLQGLADAPQTMASTLLGPQAEYQAGQQQQQLQQQSINDAVQRWNYWQSLPYQQLNQYLGQVTGNFGGTTSLTQPFYQNTGANIGAGVLGGLGAANMIGGSSGIFPGAIAKLFGGIFSDRRLKTDIERVGTLDNGLPVHVFRYIGDDRFRLGLMADEVEEVRPAAIGEAFGFKTVDYERAVR
jgi:Chaperone of endosialidase